MTESDAFKFSRLKMFDSIKGNCPEGAREICDVFEDLLFVWSFSESNLLVVNWRSAQSNETKNAEHQVRIAA